MEIKSYNIAPTDENILQSIINNTYGRNETLRCYLELLDKAKDISVFSLNADWGEGKTFFALQAKMILEYLNPNCVQDEEIKTRLDSLFTQPESKMKKPAMTRTIFPVYYNAWLYDDHKDPLTSFLYFLSVTFQKKYSKLDSGGLEKLGSALNIITTWKHGVTFDSKKIGEAITGKDISFKIAYLEDAKQLVDEAFHNLLEENDGLIVFVDEIDRCNPRYAIDFLECIKHFFDCANVQFVFSTNIKQLAESICNVYGAGFDGTRYLNKFFDCPLELPPVERTRILGNVSTSLQENYLSDFAQSLMKSLSFSIREINDFYGQAPLIMNKCHNAILHARDIWEFDTQNDFSYICYPITLFALSLVDLKKYDSFKNGNGEDLFLDLLLRCARWEDIVYSTLRHRLPKSPDETACIEAVKADYRRIFGPEAVQSTTALKIRHKIFELASLLG